MNIKELKKNLSFILKPGVKQTITPMIHGKPGIGKSDAVRQICKQLSTETNIKYDFIDLRLSQLESSDLRGIPVPDIDKGIAKWLPPEFLPFEGVEKFKGTHGILLLDEMNRARTDVLQAAFQLVLDRRVGLHKLLDSWFIVAAGNLGLEDGTDVNEFDSALNNRFIHFTVSENLDDWIDWARKSEIHSDIITFIQSKPNMLYYEIKEEADIFVTPRSWEKFSDILKANKDVDPIDITTSLGPSILNGVAGHFRKFLESKEIISPKDILFDYNSKINQGNLKKKVKMLSRDQIYALNSELVDFIAKNINDKITSKKLEKALKNIYNYCKDNLEKDIYIAFMQSLTKACNNTKSNFIDEYLKKFQDESKLIIKILSSKE